MCQWSASSCSSEFSFSLRCSLLVKFPKLQKVGFPGPGRPVSVIARFVSERYADWTSFRPNPCKQPPLRYRFSRNRHFLAVSETAHVPKCQTGTRRPDKADRKQGQYILCFPSAYVRRFLAYRQTGFVRLKTPTSKTRVEANAGCLVEGGYGLPRLAFRWRALFEAGRPICFAFSRAWSPAFNIHANPQESMLKVQHARMSRERLQGADAQTRDGVEPAGHPRPTPGPRVADPC